MVKYGVVLVVGLVLNVVLVNVIGGIVWWNVMDKLGKVLGF